MEFYLKKSFMVRCIVLNSMQPKERIGWRATTNRGDDINGCPKWNWILDQINWVQFKCVPLETIRRYFFIFLSVFFLWMQFGFFSSSQVYNKKDLNRLFVWWVDWFIIGVYLIVIYLVSTSIVVVKMWLKNCTL